MIKNSVSVLFVRSYQKLYILLQCKILSTPLLIYQLCGVAFRCRCRFQMSACVCASYKFTHHFSEQCKKKITKYLQRKNSKQTFSRQNKKKRKQSSKIKNIQPAKNVSKQCSINFTKKFLLKILPYCNFLNNFFVKKISSF